MAKPIKETPILKGKDAQAFMRQMQANKAKPTSPLNTRIKRNYEVLSKIAKFK